jgi:hypothetical protein
MGTKNVKAIDGDDFGSTSHMEKQRRDGVIFQLDRGYARMFTLL